MAANKAGSLYLVDIKHVPTEVRARWRQQLPNNEKNAKVVSCKVLGLIEGTRSYQCEVVGVPFKFILSSKALATVQTSGPRPAVNNEEETSSDEKSCSGEDESGVLDGEDGSGEDADDFAETGFAHLTALDWRKVNSFEDQCLRFYPNVDKDKKGSLKQNMAINPVDLFLASPWMWSSVGSNFGSTMQKQRA
jgi:hypothetical protein